MKSLNQRVWLICLGIFLVGCRTSAQATPTAVPVIPTEPAPAPSATPVVGATETVATETAVPPATLAPTQPVEPTATAIDTSPTEQPTAVVTETAQIELTLIEPAATDTLVAGQEVTVRGQLSPATDSDLTVTLVLAGDLVLFEQQVRPDENGEWQATAVISATHTGHGQLTVSLAGSEQTLQQPVTISPQLGTAVASISMTNPTANAVVVAGRMILFNGNVNLPSNDTVTIAVLDNNCSSTAATQSFTVTGGNWTGYTIVAGAAAPGPACAIAYTGTRGSVDSHEVRIPIDIVRPDDPQQPVILQLGNTEELFFQANNSTYLFGIGINAVNNEVNIRLEADDPARPSGLITSATAFSNQYGFWEIDLAIPEDARGLALLYITVGKDDNSYREIRIPVRIEP